MTITNTRITMSHSLEHPPNYEAQYLSRYQHRPSIPPMWAMSFDRYRHDAHVIYEYNRFFPMFVKQIKLTHYTLHPRH